MSAGAVAGCPCGVVWELHPEYSGRLVECPECGHRQHAGHATGWDRAAAPGVDPAFDRDLFLLRQRVFAVAARYDVCDAAGRPILYVERPTYPFRWLLGIVLGVVAAAAVWMLAERVEELADEEAVVALVELLGGILALAAFVVISMSLRPLRHVGIWRDEQRAEPLLWIRQDQRWALWVRTYTVFAPDGTVLARLEKTYLHNVLRKRWRVVDPSGRRVALAIEDSVVFSLLRRILPLSLFGLLRTDFLLLGGARADEPLGEFRRSFTVFDRYVLDLGDDSELRLDRRVALALGVMLDTGERR